MTRSLPARCPNVVLLALLFTAAPAAVRADDRCPYGHEIPERAHVLYGYPVWSEELEEAIDQGKVVLGGCEVFEGAPETTLVCPVCGFELKVSPEGGYWHRESSDLASFEFSLPSFFDDFRESLADGIERAGQAPHYAQSIKDGVVTKDYAAFEVRAREEVTVAAVRQVIAENPRLASAARESELPPSDPQALHVAFVEGDHAGWIAVTRRMAGHQVVAVVWELSPAP